MHLDVARMCVVVSVGVFASAATAAANDDADFPQRLAALVNQYRESHGRPALVVDATIASLAREHSVAMAKSGQLNHDDFPSRVRRSGLAMCVENVGWNYRSPKGQFEGWRASPGHDRNMLDPRVDRMGIGTGCGLRNDDRVWQVTPPAVRERRQQQMGVGLSRLYIPDNG